MILPLVAVLFDLLKCGLLTYRLNLTDTNFLKSGTNKLSVLMLMDSLVKLGIFFIASPAYQLFFGSWLTKASCI